MSERNIFEALRREDWAVLRREEPVLYERLVAGICSEDPAYLALCLREVIVRLAEELEQARAHAADLEALAADMEDPE